MLPKLGRGLPEAAEHRPAVRRGRDLPQPFHPVRALRAGAGQPADQPLPDEPSRGAEHHSARRPLHQPRPRAAPRRLRPGPGRLHHDHARPAHDRRPRSALPGAGRHHGRLPPRRRLRALQGRLFRLGGEPGLQAAGEPRGHLAARRRHAQGRAGHGATARPSRIPKELSDTAWFTERGLSYLRGRAGKPWFLHLGYYRPHPPFIALGALPRDVPAGGHAQGGARRQRRRRRRSSTRCSPTM